MQLSTAVLALFTTACAAPNPVSRFSQNVTLKVESANKDLNCKGLTNIHFGAAINGVLLSGERPIYQYDPSSKQVANIISIDDGLEQVPFVLSELFGDLVASGTGAPYALLEDDGYLAVNGSNSVFYACSQLEYDPYDYLKSSNGHGVGIYASNAPSYCEPIKIRAM